MLARVGQRLSGGVGKMVGRVDVDGEWAGRQGWMGEVTMEERGWWRRRVDRSMDN